MEQYVPEFSARDIDGEQLLQMDGSKLKVRTVECFLITAGLKVIKFIIYPYLFYTMTFSVKCDPS